VIELKFLKYFEKEEVVDVINELHEEFVDDIIKKVWITNFEIQIFFICFKFEVMR